MAIGLVRLNCLVAASLAVSAEPSRRFSNEQKANSRGWPIRKTPLARTRRLGRRPENADVTGNGNRAAAAR
jgi:hypothetical protein